MVITSYQGDYFVVDLEDGDPIRTITITREGYSHGQEYAPSIKRDMKSPNELKPFSVMGVGKPYTSEPGSQHWDMGENIPIIEPVWASLLPCGMDSIGWEQLPVKLDDFPKGFDTNVFLQDKSNRAIISLPYCMDAEGNKLDLGINGRGKLGRFGPNGAADPVVTRWKYDEYGSIILDSEGNPILQVVIIKRKDNGELAIPGGMNIDSVTGKPVPSFQTLAREYLEETSGHAESDERKSEKQQSELADFMKIVLECGVDLFRGYVNDPRNTTHAWMVTTLTSIHDVAQSGGFFDRFERKSGFDTSAVNIIDWSPMLQQKLYANHIKGVNACYEFQRRILKQQ